MLNALAQRFETYDLNGNTKTSVGSSGTPTFNCDYENRLTSVVLPGSGGTVNFKYDPFGRRIYKSSTSGTSVYAYDGDNLIEETKTERNSEYCGATPNSLFGTINRSIDKSISDSQSVS